LLLLITSATPALMSVTDTSTPATTKFQRYTYGITVKIDSQRVWIFHSSANGQVAELDEQTFLEVHWSQFKHLHEAIHTIMYATAWQRYE
jgi:hypothetical protein